MRSGKDMQKMPNKCIMSFVNSLGILLADKALLKSPYAKRYVEQGNHEKLFMDL